jgi:hypothetical protein
MFRKVYPHLMTETDTVSETLRPSEFLEYLMIDEAQKPSDF